MSEDKTDKIPPVGDEGKGETTEPVAPPPVVKQTAETRPETKRTKDRPRRKRGIMRSFFSHIIVAALAVAGVGGYFHWEDILSQTGGRVCAYEVLGKYGSSEPGTKTATTSKDQGSTANTAAEKAPEAKSEETAQPKPAAPASDAQSTEMKPDEKPAATKEVAKAEATDSADKSVANEAAAKTEAPKADESVSSEQPNTAAVPKTDETDAPKVSIVRSSDKNSFEAERDNARRIYWVDEKAAEKAYLELIAQYPDRADIKGELGNIYVKAGNNEKAAAQFFDAGMIWVKSGEKDKATKLVGLLEKLSSDKAASLKEALANAG